METVAVVGASLAGVHAAATLREEGFDGDILLLGDEATAPYDRPPLSKQLLAGTWQPDQVRLHVDLEALGIEHRTATRAVALDAARRVLTLDGGEQLAADGIVLATGATPRQLPGPHLDGVHVLRTLDDALALRTALDAGPARVAVIGAGFIGAEVAATCRGRGQAVTLIEALPWPLGRVLGEDVGRMLAGLHEANGVDVRLGVGVERLEADTHGHVRAVHLADASVVESTVVVVGIGVRPATDWLDGSGLTLDDGIVCDETLLAAPGITAAGDVARWPHRGFDEVLRIEHWDHAIDSGRAAARRLLTDAPHAYTPVPWFWSDQYDRKIQLAGRASPHDEARVLVGSFDEDRVAVAYRRGERLVGVLGINRPRQVVQARMLIERGASWDEGLALGDGA